MLRRRIVYILLILSSAILYLFSNETVTLALLISLIAAPFISLGFMSASGKNLKIELEAVETNKYVLKMHNPDIMPIADVTMNINCRNLRTGEFEVIPVTSNLGPKSRKEIPFEFTAGHAGRYEISLELPKITDALGLWARKMTADSRQYITVLPEIFDVGIEVTSSSAAMLESDRYAENKSGNDPGEVRSIREYIPGDPVKNIHWKLSEKTGKMLVKELGLPITDQFLVILDTASDIGLDPEALDSVASVVVSITRAFRAEDVDFSIGWTDTETGAAVTSKIRTDEDLAAATDEFLSIPSTSHSAFERIERGSVDSRFAHLILVSSRIPDGIESITNGCQVTIVLYGENASISSESISVIGFNEHTYKTELARIEV